jgi:hypothetical protein
MTLRRCPTRYAVFLLVVLSAGALSAAPVTETEVAVPVKVITAKDLGELPFCGRVVLEAINIPPSPALDISRGTIKVPRSANTATLIDNLQVRGSDGSVQRAVDPICFENIEVIRNPLQVIYGSDAVAGVVNITTSRSDRPLSDSANQYTSNFFAEPVLNPSQLQMIRGPFDGKWPGTSVDVGGKPGLILAETPHALFWKLPDGMSSGSISLTITDAGRGATFPVYVLGLAMAADQLNLLRGQSTRMQATVLGPDLVPADAWKAGDAWPSIDLKYIRQQFPNFKVPKPGEPAAVFFRVDNVSRDTVSMRPSKNESFITTLDRSAFASGPYTYGATIQSKNNGGFTINGLVVAFFAPIPGQPLAPPAPPSQPGPPPPPPAR